MRPCLNANDGEGYMGDAVAEGLTPPIVGRQWIATTDAKNVGFGVEGKTNIGYLVANYEGADSKAFESQLVDSTVGASPLLSFYGASAEHEEGDEDSYLVSKEPISFGGAARFYVNLKTLADAGNDAWGVFIGLTETDHASANTKPTRLEAVLGIRAVKPDNKFKLNQGVDEYDAFGVEGVNPDAQEGTLIGFEINAEQIIAMQYPTVGDEGFPLAVDPDNVDGITDQVEFSQLLGSPPLYPYVIFISSAAHAEIDEVQMSPDAEVLAIKTTYTTIVKTNGTRGWQNGGEVADGVQFYLDFTGKNPDDTDITPNGTTIADFLGFDNGNRQPARGFEQGKTAKGVITAIHAAGLSLKGQGYYVELMTGTCEGYDGETGQRKNILAVIPESDSDEKILFQPAFPIFLEMNNSHPMVLRNIRARLLQTDGSQLPVGGFNSMTLLFK